MKRFIVGLLFVTSTAYAQTGSVTTDLSGNVIKPAAVNFPTPIPLKLNGVTINALPGNLKYWGTNGAGTFGYYNLPTGFSGLFTDLDFTGNNLTFMNGTTMWKSTGDSDDPVTHPYTATNSGIIVKDANNVEVWRLWASDPQDSGANFNTWNLYLGYEAGLTQPSDNTSAGFGNTGIGHKSTHAITEGFFNTSIGVQSGLEITTGDNNTAIGGSSGDTVTTGNNNTAIGALAFTTVGNLNNTILIGYNVNTSTSNTTVIGNSSTTDVYFGSTSALAKVHASNLVGGFTAHFSRGGAAIQVGDKTITPWTIKHAGTITGFIISADQGTCTLKVWKKATGTAIPTITDVINTSGVSLSTGTHIDSATVSDFTTTAVANGDQFIGVVTAVSGGTTDITFQVPITR